MLNKNKEIKYDWIKVVKNKIANQMEITAQRLLNLQHYHLSQKAKTRLKWLYILYHQENGNVTKSANKIGISRQWLSKLKSIFEQCHKDPRSLEPKSTTPDSTANRKRIPSETERLIVKTREDYGWGKTKLTNFLKTEYGLKVAPNTVNKYLHKHHLINPKLSLKNFNVMKNKKQREKNIDPILKVKFRPPTKLKDYTPGALIEKDMKYVLKMTLNNENNHLNNHFWYQQTMIDTFTRIRTTELTKDFKSKTVALARAKMIKKFPFPIACENTDNGSENNGEYSDLLQDENVFHFYSNVGTPTDNPRVERSHLTDEIEFYSQGRNRFNDFEKQKKACEDYEYIYNFKRPHQALGYLTPMKFYELWKQNPTQAYRITEKWQKYLRVQRQRLREARRIKRKEQIEVLMKFIDIKLNNKKGLKKVKSQLADCQLCSVA